MSDIVKIIYNGQDAFAPQTTPLVGLDEQTILTDERWGVAEALTLNGQLTGCSFAAIVAAQNDLLSRFNQSYQTLQIWQQTGSLSGLVFQKDLVEVQSITFPSDRMFGALPYSINLTCYPSGLFSGAFGILSPQDTWSFKEEQNETLSVTHSISCQPFNTSSGPSNALTNARNWAFGRTGLNGAIYPVMISGVSPAYFCLLTQTENIDRFNGTYAITETYTNDLARTGYGVIRYQTNIESGNNVISVSLQGTADGCGRNLSGMRAELARIDMLAVATKQYQSAFGLTDLNPIPLSQSFNEDPFTTSISFSYDFDNSNLPSVWFDYTVDLSVGTNGLITASIQGIVRARGGDLASKLTRCKAFAATVDLYSLVLPFYNPFDVSSIVPLNPVPTSNGQTNNETDGTVGLNATYTNQEQVSAAFDAFTYTIDIIPSIAQVDAKPVLNGLGTWSVVNLKFGTRASLTVNGTATVNRTYPATLGAQLIRQKAYALFAQYGSFNRATLDKDVVTMSRTDDRVLSFSFAWSCGPNNVVGPTSVNSLAI